MTDSTDVFKRAKDLQVRLESLKYRQTEIQESIDKLKVQSFEQFGGLTVEELPALKEELQVKLDEKLEILKGLLEDV